MTGPAHLLPRDLEGDGRTFESLPEIDIECVLQVGTLLRRLGLFFALPTEKLREDVAKTAGLAFAAGRLLAEVIGEIEAAEVHVRLGPSAAPCTRPRARETVRRIEAVLVVHLALLRIAQNVICFLYVLETLFGRFITGIQIRMILARQLAIRFADFI